LIQLDMARDNLFGLIHRTAINHKNLGYLDGLSRQAFQAWPDALRFIEDGKNDRYTLTAWHIDWLDAPGLNRPKAMNTHPAASFFGWFVHGSALTRRVVGFYCHVRFPDGVAVTAFC
jgi:hypothetical protein